MLVQSVWVLSPLPFTIHRWSGRCECVCRWRVTRSIDIGAQKGRLWWLLSTERREDTLCCLWAKATWSTHVCAPPSSSPIPLIRKWWAHFRCSSHTRPRLLWHCCGSECRSPRGEAPAISLLVACYISLVAGLKPCSWQQAIIVLMFSAKLLRFNCGLLEFSRSQFLVFQMAVLKF